MSGLPGSRDRAGREPVKSGIVPATAAEVFKNERRELSCDVMLIKVYKADGTPKRGMQPE
jgi:hypothetical protein